MAWNSSAAERSQGVVKLLTPGALAEFLRAYPAVETSLQIFPMADDIFRELHAGSLDLGLCAGDDPTLVQVFLYGEPLMAAVPASLAFAGSTVMPIPSLVKLPMIATPPACTVRRQVEGALPARLQHALEVQNLDAALSFAAQGIGVAVLPAGMCAQAPESVRILPLDPPLDHRIYAYWRSGGAIQRTHPLVRLLSAPRKQPTVSA